MLCWVIQHNIVDVGTADSDANSKSDLVSALQFPLVNKQEIPRDREISIFTFLSHVIYVDVFEGEFEGDAHHDISQTGLHPPAEGLAKNLILYHDYVQYAEWLAGVDYPLPYHHITSTQKRGLGLRVQG